LRASRVLFLPAPVPEGSVVSLLAMFFSFLPSRAADFSVLGSSFFLFSGIYALRAGSRHIDVLFVAFCLHLRAFFECVSGVCSLL